ncbi:ankyrin repeat domain-containing 50 [Pelobates cultripes]|uniref:Ankyrin repeat domain-containing 50 n=1 Tax=Pelobates cultripes TaxID=61616 RepID=A0AAD1VSE2_PELCU|nr:ankyrin repeat domain-containing 50 [Pelobates cultripes]
MTHNPLRRRAFYCREWALQKLQHYLEGLGGTRTSGILITGAAGAGKTALCKEIIWPSSAAGHCSQLSTRVLAYHFCQAHTHASLNPHQFIVGLAQQLRESSLIDGYEEDISDKGDLDDTFKRMVVGPLMAVPPPSQNILLIVDSLDEMCCCCQSDGFLAESSFSIAELLVNNLQLLPPWLLLVCSARRQNKALTRMFSGFRKLCLDDLRKAHVVRDVQQYILCRLDREESLRQHLTLDTAEMLNQLHIKSNGCFLYLERVLDGVSEGSILLREIRHIPGTLNGLYLWLCQRLFPGKQFCQVQTLLNVLLASSQPLSQYQLHQTVWTKQVTDRSTEDFNKNLNAISGLLLPLDDLGDMQVLFHHSFSEWLLDVKYCSQKYLCSVAEGHSMLAMSLSVHASNLNPDEVHKLARHLLLSDLRGLEPSHLALWLLWLDVPVSQCLSSNVSLELEVLQLLLLAGGALDSTSNVVDSSALRRTLVKGNSVEMLIESGAGLHQRDRSGRTLLAAAAYAGNLEAVNLMISRGANLEATDDEGQTSLGLAAHHGHLSVVQMLLQHGAHHNHTDCRGWTPLRSAAWAGHTDIVEVLLASGAQPDVSGPDGRTALRAAAWGGHEGPIRALLAAGAEIDHADAEGRTPLMAAAYMGHKTVTEILLAAGADVNKCDSEGRSALAVASLCVPAGHEYPELVSLLLEHGADPELEDKDGVTPLLVAVYEGQAEVAELLLEAGADPNRADKSRMTPLLAAASGGHAEVIRVLLLWGSKIDATDSEGRSSLAMAAAATGGEQAVRVLLDRGLDENHRDRLGWTPLHWAACQGRRSSCRALIEGGAKVGIRDYEGYTPFLLASQEGHTGCVELLLNRSSHIEQCTNDGRTALCLAALAGHRSTVELLLRRRADPNVKNRHGKPLLYLLVLEGQLDMVEILLEHGADPEGRDLEDRTALHACCWQGDLEMTHLLLVKGRAQPNSCDVEKRTPLHCAAWRGHANIAHILLDNGAFSDAQTSQGATPLCIAAQEGHEELAKVLLEEGRSCPHHADHYGRTPVRVAGKGGHITIVNLLEKYGVPPYHGPMGITHDKVISVGKTVEGSDGSWSTLSPVSTGSHSQGNSLKSSKGSILTSSTYHSQATVLMDSLTFTQQLQQQSLPRSRSRQTIALTEITTFEDHNDYRTPPVKNQYPSSFLEVEKCEKISTDKPSSQDHELKRNEILTNSNYGSPLYTPWKICNRECSSVMTTITSSSQDNCFNPLKTSSSGYSSSRTVNLSHKKTGNSIKSEDLVHSLEKQGEPTSYLHILGAANSHENDEMLCSSRKIGTVTPAGKNGDPVIYTKKLGHANISMNIRKPACSPQENIDAKFTPCEIDIPVYSPSKSGNPVYPPGKSGNPVYSPSKSGNPVYSPGKSGSPVYSPSKSGNHVYSPGKSGNPVYSPGKSGNPVYHPGKSGNPVYSQSKSGNPVYSPGKSGSPVYSPGKSGNPVYSPGKSGNPVYSPGKSGNPVYSPCKSGNPVYSPGEADDGGCSSHKATIAKVQSPVISITTMDPQLHLKQAIKLQFEGRTCGFNMRKETPL